MATYKTRSIYYAFVALFFTLIISGCGGGEDIGNYSTDIGNDFINITNYTLTPSTIQNGTQFKVSWSVNHTNPVWYWVEFHMNSTNSIPEDSSKTQHFFFTCMEGFLGTCGKTASVTCDVITNSAGKLSTSCYLDGTSGSSQPHEITFTGNGYAILKACIHDRKMNEVCDQKSKAITVQ